MAIFEAKQLNFYYPDQTEPTLKGLDVQISSGEFVVICGPSGSGKSTFLRQFKREIAPHGKLSGELYYNNQSILSHSPERIAQEIGFVFQDPENQIVMETVREELVFGLENLGVPTSVMRRQLSEITHALGLEDLLSKNTIDLSGGQKQLVNLASVLLLNPKVILLDEPTAQLDPVTAKEFLQFVKQLNSEYGLTVLMVEHRLEDALPLADRLIVMDEGEIVHFGSPRDVLLKMFEREEPRYRPYLPSPAKLYWSFSNRDQEQFPLNVKDGRRWLSKLSIPIKTTDVPKRVLEPNMAGKKPLLEARQMSYRYEKHGRQILDHLSLELFKGEFLSIVGANGSGKSTLLKLLSGLLSPQSGQLFYNGKKIKKGTVKLAYLPQNPKTFFIHDTVEEELLSIGERLGLKDVRETVEQYLEVFQLTPVKTRHPYDLSGGELQKAALVGVLLGDPDILLIDEPTKGLDPKMKDVLGDHLNHLRENGVTVVLVTHDIEFAALFSTRCAMLFEGQVTTEAPVQEFFKGNAFYTTTINRLTRNQENVPEVITLKEAIETWARPKDERD